MTARSPATRRAPARRRLAGVGQRHLTWSYVAWVLASTALAWRRAERATARVARDQAEIARRWERGQWRAAVDVVLLLPMLREQDTAGELLRNVCRLEYPPERVLVVPVTTQREEAEAIERRDVADALVADLRRRRAGASLLWAYSRWFSTGRLRSLASLDGAAAEAEIARILAEPSTRQIVERLLQDERFALPIRHVHYPLTSGNKASQMNYALTVLAAEGRFADPSRVYVGVYDADSAPHPLSLVSLALLAEQDLAAAFQQYPIYLAGADARGNLMRNEAWLQSARSIAVEYPRQQRVNAQLARRRVAGATFTYCIGHGQFLRADWLLAAGFPEEPPIDDLPTGFMLSLARRRIVPLPFFDVCSVPDGAFDFVRQTQTWLRSQLDLRGPLARARRHLGGVPRRRLARGAAEQAAANAAWLLKGPLGPVALLLSVRRRSRIEAASIVAATWLEARVGWSITRRLLDEHMDTQELPRLSFGWSALARPSLSSVGPWLALAKVLTGRRDPPYKSER